MSGWFGCRDPRPRVGAEDVGCCSPAQPFLPGRQWSASSVLRCVCNTVGKASVVLFNVSLQSFHSYFLPMFSSLPFSAALQSSRKLLLSARVLRQLLSPHWLYAGSVSYVNMSCSWPGDVCVPMIQPDQQPLAIPPENQAYYKPETFLGEIREIYAVPAGNLPGFSQRY